MAGGIIVILISAFLSVGIIARLQSRYSTVDARFLKSIFWYHLALSFAYYAYVLFNPSDSKAYFSNVLLKVRGQSWGDYYGTSSPFIEFIGYPLIHYLSFSYEAMMATFSFLGFLGFVYFYLFFRENIRFKHSVLGTDFLKLIFFLPNLHFWSASYGKGGIIFLGLGLFFFGISRINKRVIPIIVGGMIIYHVRPHIMFVVLLSSAIGFIFSTKGVKTGWRIAFIAGAAVAFTFIYRDVLTLVGVDQEEALSQGLDLTHRATELTKATSGVDITSYSLPMQVFTFLYRPLFIDAPGALGIIVSFENVFYLVATMYLFGRWRGITFISRSSMLVKSAFFSFLTVSIALAQISGNLGLAIRQKSQVMILFMFVIISFLDEQKMIQYKALKRKQLIRQRLAERQKLQTPQNT